MSLLLAGVLASAVIVGCNKETEGSTDAPTTTDGKMDAKTDDTKMGTAEPTPADK
jgi:hypothetical protein